MVDKLANAANSKKNKVILEEEEGMFYLTTHSVHFIYGYMASDIW